eukprot:2267882-Ditylum_brightwellii.AAC.1
MPPMIDQSLSILISKLESLRYGSSEDLEKLIQSMVPTRRQLLSVFRTTIKAVEGYTNTAYPD